MNGKQYLMTQIALVECGKKIADLDLDAFLKCIANAETMAPLLDPTLYRQAQDNLRGIKKLAEAFKSVQTEFAVVQEAVIKTSVAYMVRGETQPTNEEQLKQLGADPQGSGA